MEVMLGTQEQFSVQRGDDPRLFKEHINNAQKFAGKHQGVPLNCPKQFSFT
jgi:hypothetical protein